MQKGADDLFQNTFLRSPALFFDRKNKGLKFSLSTTAMEKYPQVIEHHLVIIIIYFFLREKIYFPILDFLITDGIISLYPTQKIK